MKRKIGIVSDTHGDHKHLEKALMKMEALAGGRLDTLIHCGDLADDIRFISGAFLQVIQVRGNCDRYSCDAPEEMLTDICEIPFFITHGHRYAVKQGTDLLASRAVFLGARICLFGHTHIPYTAHEQGVLLVNPGACIYTGRCAMILIDDSGEFELKLL